MPTLRYHLSTLWRETCGAEIAEAAAVLPLMFLFLLGIFWFGQAFSIYGAITRAAQDGARAEAAPYCVTCAPPKTYSPGVNAVNAVNASLRASKLDPAQIQALSSPPSVIACSSASTNCASVSGSNVCVQESVQISSTSGGGMVCGVSVTFQYPFQFWLPFTSLNKQRILMTASARVRMEEQ